MPILQHISLRCTQFSTQIKGFAQHNFRAVRRHIPPPEVKPYFAHFENIANLVIGTTICNLGIDSLSPHMINFRRNLFELIIEIIKALSPEKHFDRNQTAWDQIACDQA